MQQQHIILRNVMYDSGKSSKTAWKDRPLLWDWSGGWVSLWLNKEINDCPSLGAFLSWKLWESLDSWTPPPLSGCSGLGWCRGKLQCDRLHLQSYLSPFLTEVPDFCPASLHMILPGSGGLCFGDFSRFPFFLAFLLSCFVISCLTLKVSFPCWVQRLLSLIN